MKKTNVYRAGAFLLGGLLMAACAKPLIEQKPAEELTLKASAESVVLDQLAEQDEALRLTWGAGSNEGTGAAIRYILEMDLAGNGFAGGMKDSLGKTDVHFMAFSHGELNDTILTEYWGIDPDEEKEYAFEARVIADVASPLVQQQVSNVVSFKLKTYKRRHLNLFLIGDAAPNGWDMGRATLLPRVDGSMEQFTWTGELKTGGFKFICQNTDGRWWPGYVCDPASSPEVTVPSYQGKLALYESDPGGDKDIKFNITTPGTYTVTLNTATLEMTCTLVAEGDPELYLIGTAAGGWDNSLVGAYKMDYADGVFTWEGALNADGQLRFVSAVGSFWPGYARDGSQGGKVKYFAADPPADEDLSFDIVHGGTYRVTVNSETLDITIEPTSALSFDHVYMIGDFNNWSVETPAAMSGQEGTFTYQGNLQAGAFRFITMQGRFWPGFTRNAADGLAKFQAIQPAASEDDDDNRFTVEADGNYVVTLDTSTGEVTMQAQGTSGYSHVWVLGDATENGWDWDAMPEMTRDAANPDVFIWTGMLQEGQIKFPLDKSQGSFVGDCVVAKADNTPIGTDLDFDIEYIPQNDAAQYDRKWFVSDGQVGTYTVRLDFSAKKISFTKQ